ncbi:MAG: SRPBCC domain-containing protein [Bacteroidota bacterium]
MTAMLIGLFTGIFTALILLIWKLPSKVQYIESIEIDAPIQNVYDAIRYQEQLMQWSAWPKETKSLCRVENTDGEVGAQTIYLNSKGKKFGYQEITELLKNEKISFYLKSHVAPFEEEVKLDFLMHERTKTKTQVYLFFNEKLKKPAFLIAYFGNIINWVHKMHLKDLNGLKIYVEKQ